LVASVVPCTNWSTCVKLRCAPRSTGIPCRTARDGSSGVVRHLKICRVPAISSYKAKSVNVLQHQSPGVAYRYPHYQGRQPQLSSVSRTKKPHFYPSLFPNRCKLIRSPFTEDRQYCQARNNLLWPAHRGGFGESEPTGNYLLQTAIKPLTGVMQCARILE